MENSLYYLLVALPPLPKIGEKPPIALDEVRHLVQEGDSLKIKGLVDAFLLERAFKVTIQEKILMSQPHDDAHISQISPISLISETSQTFADSQRGRAVNCRHDQFPVDEIPEILAQALQSDLRVLGEDHWLAAAWRAFFQFFRETGETIGSSLLCRWVSFESSLREQLMIVRNGLPLSDDAYKPWDHRVIIDSWASQADPMIGERLLDEARWQFIDQEIRSYSFDLDELTAYLLKLGLLARHASLSRERGVKILEEITIL